MSSTVYCTIIWRLCHCQFLRSILVAWRTTIFSMPSSMVVTNQVTSTAGCIYSTQTHASLGTQSTTSSVVNSVAECSLVVATSRNRTSAAPKFFLWLGRKFLARLVWEPFLYLGWCHNFNFPDRHQVCSIDYCFLIFFINTSFRWGGHLDFVPFPFNNNFHEFAYILQPHVFAFFPLSPMHNLSSPLLHQNSSNTPPFLPQSTQSLKKDSSHRLMKKKSILRNSSLIAHLLNKRKNVAEKRKNVCLSQNQQFNRQTLYWKPAY